MHVAREGAQPWVAHVPLRTHGMSEEEVLKRLGSQMDRSERLALVDVVVDNSGDMAQLEKTINSLWDSRVKKRIAHA